jgi:hypothetical protein
LANYDVKLGRGWIVGAYALIIGGCAAGSSGSTPAVLKEAPSYENYVQAAQLAVQCMNDRGASARFVETDRQRINISISGTAQAVDIDTIYDDCTTKHLVTIERAFLSSISPSREDALVSLRKCLVEHGVVDESATDEDVDRAMTDLPSDDPLQEQVAMCRFDAFQPKP